MNKKDFNAAVAAGVQRLMSERAAAAGKLGGAARAAKLSPRRRKAIAVKAIKTRWANHKALQNKPL